MSMLKVTGLPGCQTGFSQLDGFRPSSGKASLDRIFSIVDCLDRLTEKASSFIEERSQSPAPFFLYFPLTAPHKPALPHSRYEGRSGLGPYGDFVIQVDEVIGSILDTIDAQGITDDTVVFYTSDNGSYMYRYQDPEINGSCEGCIRPGFFRRASYCQRSVAGNQGGHMGGRAIECPSSSVGRKKIKAGSKSHQTITHTDFLRHSGIPLPGGRIPNAKVAAQDSFDFSPLLLGQEKDWKRSPVIHPLGRRYVRDSGRGLEN